ncbi:claudin-4-like [Archocentrus centrarchus]|uniref:claudin-4-like n=1 Tax=Archocentrus centrarchus TaxID=63155 RepID=UPI0011E9C36E|nr:claudin-4-like [Archocentrus centrarchus]
MSSAEILGVALAFLGWILSIASCVLPMWEVTAFTDRSFITSEMTWEGIWMSCMFRSTGQIACDIYDSILDLKEVTQVARALTITSIVLGILGLFAAIIGAKWTTCLDEEAAKARMMIVAGVALILASLTQIIPVSWFAHDIVKDFYHSGAEVKGEKKEFGEALYLGWAAAVFLLIGGGIFVSSWHQKRQKKYGPPSKIYSQPKSVTPSDYDKRGYV